MASPLLDASTATQLDADVEQIDGQIRKLLEIVPEMPDWDVDIKVNFRTIVDDWAAPQDGPHCLDDEKARNTSSTWTLRDLQDRFHMSFVNDENMYTGCKLPHNYTTVLADLIGDLTVVDPLKIPTVLEDDVPEAVKKNIKMITAIVCPLLREAKKVSMDDSSSQIASSEFYHAFLKLMISLSSSGLSLSHNPSCLFLEHLSVIADLSTQPVRSTIDEEAYHRAWTLLVSDILNVVAVDLSGHVSLKEDDVKYTECKRGHFMFEGLSNFGFPIMNDSGNPQREEAMSCKPDGVVEMDDLVQVCADRNIQLQLSLPTLAMEVSTSSAFEDRRYASSSSPTGRHGSEHKDKKKRFSRHGKSASRSTSGNGNVPFKCQSSETSGDSGEVVLESACTIRTAETNLLQKIKVHHYTQLIGMLKWSARLMGRAMKECSKQNVKLQVERKPVSYGLFTVQNHIFLSNLSVVSSESTDSSNAAWQYAHLVGLDETTLAFHEDFTLQYKLSDGYLDLFDPIHFEALLDYLCVVMWHEQKCQYSFRIL